MIRFLSVLPSSVNMSPIGCLFVLTNSIRRVEVSMARSKISIIAFRYVLQSMRQYHLFSRSCISPSAILEPWGLYTFKKLKGIRWKFADFDQTHWLSWLRWQRGLGSWSSPDHRFGLRRSWRMRWHWRRWLGRRGCRERWWSPRSRPRRRTGTPTFLLWRSCFQLWSQR